MAFNIGQGLAGAADAVAKTAGTMTIESQRAELQKELVVLADQMATRRDDAQRGFLSSERVAGQEFQGGQKELDREAQREIQKLQSETSLATAGIAAGATKYSTDARTEESRLTREQSKDEFTRKLEADTEKATGFQIGEGGVGYLVNKVTGKSDAVKDEKGEPIKFRDPDAAKAQYEAIRGVTEEKRAINQQFGPQLAQANARVLQAQKPTMPGLPQTPEDKKAAADARAEYAALQRQYREMMEPLTLKGNRLTEALLGNGKSATPSAAAGVISYDASGNRIEADAPARPPSGMPGGLIMNQNY